jgi:hypothetical protein
MQQKHYAGIGSRKTPLEVQDVMCELGKELATHNFILRSGHAVGADQAFERGCKVAKGRYEYWHPDDSFTLHEWAIQRASKVCWEYPYNKMKPYTQRIITRNMYQIFGDNKTNLFPVKFVIYWCEGDPLSEGRLAGGTRYAVRAAEQENIPTYNLRNQKNELEAYLKSIKTL